MLFFGNYNIGRMEESNVLGMSIIILYLLIALYFQWNNIHNFKFSFKAISIYFICVILFVFVFKEPFYYVNGSSWKYIMLICIIIEITKYFKRNSSKRR